MSRCLYTFNRSLSSLEAEPTPNATLQATPYFL